MDQQMLPADTSIVQEENIIPLSSLHGSFGVYLILSHTCLVHLHIVHCRLTYMALVQQRTDSTVSVYVSKTAGTIRRLY